MVAAARIVFTAGMAALLTACGGSRLAPGAPDATAQKKLAALTALPATTTCDASPPQYQWIFRGACDPNVALQSTGGSFVLPTYAGITVKGAIGHNTAKGTVTLAIADATDTNGDVSNWKNKAFPKYVGSGTTILYAVAINQSDQMIKWVDVKDTPLLEYTVTDANGLPGKTCGDALGGWGRGKRHFIWTPTPAVGHVRGNRVTIVEYNAPTGLGIDPKSPLYFAVDCWTKGER
jgi:hypothetical protein